MGRSGEERERAGERGQRGHGLRHRPGAGAESQLCQGQRTGRVRPDQPVDGHRGQQESGRRGAAGGQHPRRVHGRRPDPKGRLDAGADRRGPEDERCAGRHPCMEAVCAPGGEHHRRHRRHGGRCPGAGRGVRRTGGKEHRRHPEELETGGAGGKGRRTRPESFRPFDRRGHGL